MKLFKSIKTVLTISFLLIALIPLLTTLIITYNQSTNSTKDREFEKLKAIRDLKVDDINKWLDERIGDVKTISEDNEIQALDHVFGKKDKAKEDLIIMEVSKSLIKRYFYNYNVYDELFIVNAETGIVEISTNTSSEGDNRLEQPFYTSSKKTKEVHIEGIYFSKILNKPTMTFSIPIYSIHTKKMFAILVSRIDLERSLYKLLLKRQGLGKTGETLLVNEDVMTLNELRWYDNAPFNLKIEAEPDVNAAKGKTGITESKDYRGENVLAAFTYIPRGKWGFVAKIDLDEIYEPIKQMARNFIIMFIVASILVYFISRLLANAIAKPIVEMTDISKRIREGDLKARNKLQSRDELGYLATSINNMADSIEEKILIQENNVEISNALIQVATFEKFGEEILKKYIQTTDSDFGAFYTLNTEKKQFEQNASIGLNSELLTPFDSNNPEGHFGKAISFDEISIIKDIDDDSIFKFKTLAGDAIPKEIITIPIKVRNEAFAILSLGSLKRYSDLQLQTVKNALNTLNSAYSNLVAGNETAKLAEELNLKNIGLQESQEKLQFQAEELQIQSEELQEQNIELEMQRTQVMEADRLKSEFLSNMSHELRTPLNSIMTLSRVLIRQSSDKLTSEESNFLEIIERNGKQLLALVNDILDLAKIESGSMDISIKHFSVRTLIENLIFNQKPIVHNKGLEITYNIESGLPNIESDEKRILQVLQNIIGNAIKFTEKGSITVTAKSKNDNIIIEVADTGIGIPEKDLPNIFEEFRQVDGSTSRQFEGTGLGLAISNKIVQTLEGEIIAKSKLNEGSVFTIILPIKWHSKVEEFFESDISEAQKTKSERNTILIVDNDPDVVKMLSGYLNEAGYNTIEATTGKVALDLAKKLKPFAITLDVIMPVMDGWEVLQNLKADPETKDIPIIIVTVSDDKETGLALGAVGYITKPVNKEILMNELYKLGWPYPKTVLVVDDNKIERNDICGIISKEGINVSEAEDGKDCLKQLEKLLPDIMILDLIMPEMDGFEVLNKIRSNPKTLNLPVIILTAKDLTRREKDNLQGKVSSILEKSETTTKEIVDEILKTLADIELRNKYKSSQTARILVVEDNEIVAQQVKEILNIAGYEIDIVTKGKQAIEYVKHAIPDGIILDLMMPGMDGFQVLEEIRSNKRTANIPVIILTAKDLTPDEMKILTSNNIKQLIHKGDIDKQGLLDKVRFMIIKKQIPKSFKIRELRNKTERIKEQFKEGLPVVLVVEDNPDNMLTIKAVLKDKYNILEATDGEEGLMISQNELPDLILMDISLPKLDGLAVTKHLKKDDKTKGIPVIALTAQAMKDDREKILKSGCDDYIAKPIDADLVLSKLEKWLKKK